VSKPVRRSFSTFAFAVAALGPFDASAQPSVDLSVMQPNLGALVLPYYEEQTVTFDLLVEGPFTGNVRYLVELIDAVGTAHLVASSLVFVSHEGAYSYEHTFVSPGAIVPGRGQSIRVRIDPSNVIAERDEANNVETSVHFTVLGAELAALSVVHPSTVRRGSRFTVSAGIENTRFVEARDFVYTYVLASNAGPPIPLFTSAAQTVRRGTTAVDVVGVPEFLPAGAYELVLLLDATAAVPELDETNNTISVPIVVADGMPDFRVAVDDVPIEVRGGEALEVRCTLSNDGDVAGDVEYGFVLSVDPEIGADDKLLFTTTVELAAGTSTTTDFIIPISSSIAGSFFFGATADPYERVPELDEGNNHSRGVGPIAIAGSALRIEGQPLPAARFSTPYHARLEVVGAVDTPVWSIRAGALPSGLALDDGVITGTPEVLGTWGFVVGVQDELQSATSAFEIVVEPTSAQLSFVAAELPGGEVGRPYCTNGAIRIHTVGGVAPVALRIADGGVPGLGLTTNGALCGTPLVPGRHSLIVHASDATGSTAEATFAVDVKPRGLRILTERVPNARTGEPYQALLVAADAVLPLTWSSTVGALPDGLELRRHGVVEGTPGTPGLYRFTVAATDATGATSARSLSIRVAPERVVSSGTDPRGCTCAAPRRTSRLGLALLVLVGLTRGRGSERARRRR
jgi:hypothetical protein